MHRKIIPGRNCSGLYFQCDKIGRQDAFENSEIETARRWVIWAIHREREAECWAIHEKSGDKEIGSFNMRPIDPIYYRDRENSTTKVRPSKSGRADQKTGRVPKFGVFRDFRPWSGAEKYRSRDLDKCIYWGIRETIRECRGRRSHIFDCKRSTKSEKPLFSPVLGFANTKVWQKIQNS